MLMGNRGCLLRVHLLHIASVRLGSVSCVAIVAQYAPSISNSSTLGRRHETSDRANYQNCLSRSGSLFLLASDELSGDRHYPQASRATRTPAHAHTQLVVD